MNIVRPAWPRIVELWFDEPIPAVDADVAYIRQFAQPPAGARPQPFHTLVVDLRKTEDEIFSAMSADTRNFVRRAQNKDNLVVEAFLQPTPPIIDEFLEFQRQFAIQKNLEPVKAAVLKSLTQAHMLHLTRVMTPAAETLVWHSYVNCRGRVRSLHSVSLFRGADSDFRNLTGRANRLLHWRDMVLFRSLGTEIYDFGGWYEGSEDASRLSINKFKEGFGGIAVQEFNGAVALSLLGRLYLRAKDLREAWRRTARNLRPRTALNPEQGRD